MFRTRDQREHAITAALLSLYLIVFGILSLATHTAGWIICALIALAAAGLLILVLNIADNWADRGDL